MSDFSAKNQRGLMEAYASMYQQPIQEDKVEDVEYQEYEIDTDAILESVKNYLINLGYADDEKKAKAMMPHLSESWYDQVVTEIVVEQEFLGCVNSMLEEGYDLSSYTWDDLYEDYVGYFNESQQVDLHEVLPLVAAPVLANPATWAAGAALGAGALYAGKKAFDAYRQLKGGTSKEGEAFLNQPLQARRNETPSQRRERIQANAQQRRQQQQQTPVANPPKETTTTVSSPAKPVNKPQPLKPQKPPRQPDGGGSGGGGGAGGGGGGGGTSSEAPKPPKQPINWKNLLLGKTTAGKVTRAATGLAAATADIYGSAKYGDPSWGLRALSVPTAAASLPAHLVGTAHRGTGDLARSVWDPLNVGKGTSPNVASQMWNQPWRKPAAAPANPSQRPLRRDAQGNIIGLGGG